MLPKVHSPDELLKQKMGNPKGAVKGKMKFLKRGLAAGRTGPTVRKHGGEGMGLE